jgi:acetyltransferase-like isoleucine patch superfamily enzyme
MLYSDNVKISTGGLEFSDKHGNKLTLAAAFRKALGRFYNWWWDFELFLVHLVSLHVPIYSFRMWVFLAAGVRVGKGSKIHMGVKFFKPKGVSIGEDTMIGDRAFLDGRERLKIGDHVDIASEVMIYNSEHDLEDPKFGAINEVVEIGDYVFVGPRAIILPGVKIGRGAVVAAGAVVTKSVGEREIVGGVPAKVIGMRKNKNFGYRLGRSRLFQ